ncbi:uncharacterized protein (DUF58 family) [Paenibacillus shirakamiensis]|uniref:Uncharacterized protein (DUF58 family) n=1 Tax=Paenibacillus shirakamiensis TaxID=1265935 RepID=A0ABS4JDC4_9BACL|nr:DUF58 domain-containing protein [Paenibacillus shirakamiensis]MBP1999111.1 uncharacterized protein (DUF58 family) [Paenibacillus shirakamiensis]
MNTILLRVRRGLKTSWIWKAGLLWCGCLLYMLFQGGKTPVMLLTMMTILMVYWGLSSWIGLSTIRGMRSLALDGTHGMQMQAGDQVHVKLHLELSGWMPHPYIVVREVLKRHNDESWIIEDSVIPKFRNGAELSFHTPPLERGRYYFEETECSSEDIFGIVKHVHLFSFPGEFQVLPRTVFIPYWQLFDRNSQLAGPETAQSLSRRETTQINGVRDYVYGDRMSRIHWNATAKTGTWKSKEFEHESLPKTVLVLDATSANYATSADFELAVSTAASLLDYGSRERMSMGLCTLGREVRSYFPANSGADRQRMIQHLVEVSSEGEGKITKHLIAKKELFQPGTFFVFISASKGSEVLDVLQWAKSKQMTPYHILTGDGRDNKKWPLILGRSGFKGIYVPNLQELPVSMRGGRHE